MKPLKDELIQSRLDEDELADFDKVKKLLDVKSNSVAIRQMIKDEIMLEKASCGSVLLCIFPHTEFGQKSEILEMF